MGERHPQTQRGSPSPLGGRTKTPGGIGGDVTELCFVLLLAVAFLSLFVLENRKTISRLNEALAAENARVVELQKNVVISQWDIQNRSIGDLSGVRQ